MTITRPGVLVFLQVCSFAGPAVLVSVSMFLLREHAGVHIANWLMAILAVLAIPIYHIGRGKSEYWLNERKAARLGASLPPRWDGKLIGNWDVLMHASKAYTQEFLSKFF